MKHKHDNKTIDIEDVIVWGDSDVHPTWCYRYEIDQYSHMSDDYLVVFFGTREYDEFFSTVLSEHPNGTKHKLRQ